MVNYKPEALDATFSALGDSTRRALLRRLTDGPQATTRLAEPFDMSLPAIMKHLRVLEKAGLIAGERQGRVHRYRLLSERMKGAAAWMEQYRPFWDGQLQALDQYLMEARDD